MGVSALKEKRDAVTCFVHNSKVNFSLAIHQYSSTFGLLLIGCFADSFRLTRERNRSKFVELFR